MAGSTFRHPLMTIAACALTTACATRVYEVDEGYTGWAVVKHGVASCPPLPVEQGQPIHRVPQSGVLCTSDPKEKAWLYSDRYYEVGAKRTELSTSGPITARRIWSPGDGTDGVYQFDAFFVGTWSQQEADLLGLSRLLNGQP